MVYKYWSASTIKSLPDKEAIINSGVHSKFRGVLSAIKSIKNENNGSVLLTAKDLKSEKTVCPKNIMIYVNFDNKEKGKVAFPFIEDGIIEFDLSKDNIYGNPGDYYLNISIKKITIKGSQGELFVYVERFKSFAPLNGWKTDQNSPFLKSLLKGLRLYLIVPENKTSAGEFDFLSNLHPHIWDSIIKKRVNFASAEDIASAIEHIPYSANCACVLRGGESNLDIFNEKVIHNAIQIRKKKRMIYLVAGVAHGKNGVDGLSVFDHNSTSPTAAAIFLNSQFPISTNRDQVFRQKK